jgi:hypothetical protein
MGPLRAKNELFMNLRIVAGAAITAMLGALSALAQQPVVPGEPSKAPKAAAAAELRLAPGSGARVELPPVSERELGLVREANRRSAERRMTNESRRVAIGVLRDGDVAAPSGRQMQWRAVAGGHAAQVAVTSPEALAMRLAIDLDGVPADVEMSFFGSADTRRIEGPVRVGTIRDRTLAWWTPITEGSTQTVEFFVPQAHDPRELGLRVARASHLLSTPSSGFRKRLQDIGDAGSCNVDLPCSPLNQSSAFKSVAESVAQMVFNDGSLSALCSAVLLNDSDSSTQTPWLLSANHCFENSDPPYKTPSQMQVVANTVSTIWGFEANACNSFTPRSDWTQVSGGADYLYSNDQSDALFLRLNSLPPSYAFYSGWDANAMSAGSNVVSIHHPQGDLKKVSEGSVRGFQTLFDVGRGGGSFIEVLWKSGTTEQGSSGAGLWTVAVTPAGTQYVLRGALWGGTALCSNTTGTDNYSRFDLIYPNISQYIGASAVIPGPGPTEDFTDLWWGGASEDGWGLNLVQHPSRIMFGVWYTYDAQGKRTWFTFSSGTWVAQNTYTATLQAVTGPSQDGGFDPGLVRRRDVGSVTLTFNSSNTGTFSWSVDGTSGVKSISRFSF